MHICTQPFSSTHRHFASSLWQGRWPIRIGAGFLSLQWLDSAVLLPSVFAYSLYQYNFHEAASLLRSVCLYCWSVLVFDDLFSSWSAQHTAPAVTGGHRSTVFNETVLVAHYWSPMTCKLISKIPYWLLIAWKCWCFITLCIIWGFCF